MHDFRRLATAALLAGIFSGLVLFAIQRFTVIPLIETAEKFESEGHGQHLKDAHEPAEWQPEEGWQRISLTAAATVLSSIGLAAIFLGFAMLARITLSARTGMILGLAAFACFSLAPALGLPPQPPGVPSADVAARQMWWAATAIATAIGMWMLLSGPRTWILRISGVICIFVPHVIGAPKIFGDTPVPESVLRQFAFASLASMSVFWLLLGASGGYFFGRMTDPKTSLR